MSKRDFSTREIKDYPPMLQACHIMEMTGFSNGTVYEIMRSKDCPTVHKGKRMVVPRDLFWQYFLREALKGTELEKDRQVQNLFLGGAENE